MCQRYTQTAKIKEILANKAKGLIFVSKVHAAVRVKEILAEDKKV